MKLSIKNKMQGISAAILADTRAAAQGDGAALIGGDDGLQAPRGPRTAPGHMFSQVGQMRERDATIRELEQRLDKFDDSVPTKKIAAELIEATKWANRHEQSFASEEFKELVKEIGAAGGNVQPIKVRPVPGSEPQRYEIVFGHRRHRACLELGLQVLAMIEPIDDQRLFIEMDRENRERADLRPYEQGVMYARALDAGLFPSNRKMAETLGVGVAGVGKVLAIARLPSAVLSAFDSPLDIQFAWGLVIASALAKDPDVVLTKAQEFNNAQPKPKAIDIFKALTQGGAVSSNPLEKSATDLSGKAGAKAKISFNGKKLSAVVFNVSAKRRAEFEKMIQKFLDS
jgi:ParB family chromosome partitioning protein